MVGGSYRRIEGGIIKDLRSKGKFGEVRRGGKRKSQVNRGRSAGRGWQRLGHTLIRVKIKKKE